MPTTELRNARLVLPDRIERRSLWLQPNQIVLPQPYTDIATAISIDLSNHLIFPAWINAHEHLHLNHVPPAPLPVAGFFADSYAWIDAFQTHFADTQVKAALAIPKEDRYRFGGLKNALCGTITVMHHDPWHALLDAPDYPVRVMKHYGWSHSLGLSARGQYGPSVIESYRATPAETHWFIHLAEGRSTIAQNELAQLQCMGCLHDNSVLVHGAGLSERDIDGIIAHHAHVIWCPGSNRNMLGYTLDPRQLFDAGRLGLGSDSRLTGSSDLLGELRVAKAYSDLTARELFELITIRNSAIVQMPLAGHLTIGAYADCVIARDDKQDPFETMLELTRANIRAVVRAGAPLVADPDFADWFDACRVPYQPIVIDGAAKLIDARVWLSAFDQLDKQAYQTDMEVYPVA